MDTCITKFATTRAFSSLSLRHIQVITHSLIHKSNNYLKTNQTKSLNDVQLQDALIPSRTGTGCHCYISFYLLLYQATSLL